MPRPQPPLYSMYCLCRKCLALWDSFILVPVCGTTSQSDSTHSSAHFPEEQPSSTLFNNVVLAGLWGGHNHLTQSA